MVQELYCRTVVALKYYPLRSTHIIFLSTGHAQTAKRNESSLQFSKKRNQDGDHHCMPGSSQTSHSISVLLSFISRDQGFSTKAHQADGAPELAANLRVRKLGLLTNFIDAMSYDLSYWKVTARVHTSTQSSHEAHFPPHQRLWTSVTTHCKSEQTCPVMPEVNSSISEVNYEKQRNSISHKLTFVTATSVLSANTFWTSLIKHMWDSEVFKD